MWHNFLTMGLQAAEAFLPRGRGPMILMFGGLIMLATALVWSLFANREETSSSVRERVSARDPPRAILTVGSRPMHDRKSAKPAMPRATKSPNVLNVSRPETRPFSRRTLARPPRNRILEASRRR